MNNEKSHIVGGLLAWFFGALGIHHFYIGKKKKGLIYLGITLGSMVLIFLTPIITLTITGSKINNTNTEDILTGSIFQLLVYIICGSALVILSIISKIEAIIYWVEGDKKFKDRCENKNTIDKIDAKDINIKINEDIVNVE